MLSKLADFVESLAYRLPGHVWLLLRDDGPSSSLPCCRSCWRTGRAARPNRASYRLKNSAISGPTTGLIWTVTCVPLMASLPASRARSGVSSAAADVDGRLDPHLPDLLEHQRGLGREGADVDPIGLFALRLLDRLPEVLGVGPHEFLEHDLAPLSFSKPARVNCHVGLAVVVRDAEHRDPAWRRLSQRWLAVGRSFLGLGEALAEYVGAHLGHVGVRRDRRDIDELGLVVNWPGCERDRRRPASEHRQDGPGPRSSRRAMLMPSSARPWSSSHWIAELDSLGLGSTPANSSIAISNPDCMLLPKMASCPVRGHSSRT